MRVIDIADNNNVFIKICGSFFVEPASRLTPLLQVRLGNSKRNGRLASVNLGNSWLRIKF